MKSTSKAPESGLKAEREYFEANRPALIDQYRDLYLLIKGNQLIGQFPDAERAYKQGVAKFGLRPFLVRQALEHEPVSNIPVFSVSVPSADL